MTKQITIYWGSQKQKKKTYKFKTEEQLKYFMLGVDEAREGVQDWRQAPASEGFSLL